MKLNERLIYARLSGFGQTGPYARRAGHDINYLAISGVLSHFVHKNKPVPPINMLADFAGGGLMCATGILLALLERNRSNLGQVVDLSMTEGTRYVSSYLWHTQKNNFTAKQFIWPNPEQKEANLLDGGAPFYTTYQTKDNRWVSVGAIEPQFYEELLKVLDLDSNKYPQFDLNRWSEYKTAFGNLFAQKSLQEWIELFRNADACVEPVLELNELEAFDEQATSRSLFNKDGTPSPAPRLSRTPGEASVEEPRPGEHTVEVLKEYGYSNEQIVQFSRDGTITCDTKSKL